MIKLKLPCELALVTTAGTFESWSLTNRLTSLYPTWIIPAVPGKLALDCIKYNTVKFCLI